MSTSSKRWLIAGGSIAALLVLLVLFAQSCGRRARDRDLGPAMDATPASPTAAAPITPAAERDQGYLYGRVTDTGGATYQGRLRWGGDEEAFWGDTFDGRKDENPWAAHVPPEALVERYPVELFGMVIAVRERPIALDRPFSARFGDIVRIEARPRDIRVTMKSGTTFDLDLFSADDLADGLRVWDAGRGVVDLDERSLRTIELLPTARLEAAPPRLHGTVRTRQGEFTGFVWWDWEKTLASDVLHGRASDGDVELAFDAIRSLERIEGEGGESHGARASLADGRTIELFGTRDVGQGNQGIGVEDVRFGRVLIAWDAFERVDFGPGGSGPAYDDFPPGRPLAGTVTTRDGHRLAGRVVFDLDESETTETLDAPSGGVDYRIPFGLVASIVPTGGGEGGGERSVRVALHRGEELSLEPLGDLGDANPGLLVFAGGREPPEFVPWAEVARIDLDRAAAPPRPSSLEPPARPQLEYPVRPAPPSEPPP